MDRQSAVVNGVLGWLRQRGIIPSRRETVCAMTAAVPGMEQAVLPPGTVILGFPGGHVWVTPDAQIEYRMDPAREFVFRSWLLPFLRELSLDDPVSFDLPPVSLDEVIDAHVLGRLIRSPVDLARAIDAGRALLRACFDVRGAAGC